MKKISIIVPIYNEAVWLNRCIDSILNQTYQDFELLLINDGSSDESEEICLSYMKIDDKIHYIYQENKGISAARNLGLNQARGEYITFIDADDYVSHYFLENLFIAIKKGRTLMASCNYTTTRNKNPKLDVYSKVVENEIEVISKRDMLLRTLYHMGAEFSLCDKLYHSSLFKDLRFPVGELYEDLKLIPSLYQLAGTISIHPNIDYFNYLSDDSIQRSNFTPKKLVAIKNMNELYELAEIGEDPELSEAYNYRLFDIVCEFLFMPSDDKYAEDQRQLWSLLKRLRSSVMHNKHPNASRARLGAYLSYLGYAVMKKVYKWRQRYRLKRLT